MQTLLLQFKYPGRMPSIDEARQLFNLESDEVDTEYGVIPIDPTNGIYTVLVDAKVSERVKAVLATRPHDPAEGIFANPRIDTFGPPET